MILVTIVSSLIVIVQLLGFRNKSGKRKLTYGLLANTICAVMLVQIVYAPCMTIFNALFTVALAAGAIYYEGNVSHLIKGVKKCVKNSLNL